jgi:hypothetical protein
MFVLVSGRCVIAEHRTPATQPHRVAYSVRMTTPIEPDSEVTVKGFIGWMTLWGSVAVGAAIVAVLLFALQASNWRAYFAVVAAAGAVWAAAGTIGSIVGFVFGVPRATASDDPDMSSRYRPNTNLEQISDWLTKMLVGIGLVQIGHAGAALRDLADTLAPLLGDFESSGEFGVALVLFSAGIGFIVGYLMARVPLPGLLSRADAATVRQVAREEAANELSAAARAEGTSLLDGR